MVKFEGEEAFVNATCFGNHPGTGRPLSRKQKIVHNTLFWEKGLPLPQTPLPTVGLDGKYVYRKEEFQGEYKWGKFFFPHLPAGFRRENYVGTGPKPMRVVVEASGFYSDFYVKSLEEVARKFGTTCKVKKIPAGYWAGYDLAQFEIESFGDILVAEKKTFSRDSRWVTQYTVLQDEPVKAGQIINLGPEGLAIAVQDAHPSENFWFGPPYQKLEKRILVWSKTNGNENLQLGLNDGFYFCKKV